MRVQQHVIHFGFMGMAKGNQKMAHQEDIRSCKQKVGRIFQMLTNSACIKMSRIPYIAIKTVLVALLLPFSFCYGGEDISPQIQNEKAMSVSTLQGIKLLYGNIQPNHFFENFGETKIIEDSDDRHSTFWFCYTSKLDKSTMLVRGMRMMQQYVDLVSLARDYKDDKFLSDGIDKCLVIDRSFLDLSFGGKISLDSKKNMILEQLGEGAKYKNSSIAKEFNGVILSPNTEPRLVRGEYFNDAVLYRITINVNFRMDTPIAIRLFVASECLTVPVPKK